MNEDKFIRDMGVIRDCDSNHAIMSLRQFIKYDKGYAGSIRRLKRVFHKDAPIGAYMTGVGLLLLFPILPLIAAVVVRHKAKLNVEREQIRDLLMARYPLLRDEKTRENNNLSHGTVISYGTKLSEPKA
jgi:hypothetical protein